MPKNVIQASDLAKLNQAGRYRVGERLYLQITPTGVRSWIYRYKRNGVERQKGLGAQRTVPSMLQSVEQGLALDLAEHYPQYLSAPEERN